jgi:hypothetical protein
MLSSKTDNKSTRFNRWGVIAALITFAAPIIIYIRISSVSDTTFKVLYILPWIIPTIVMLIRSFMPPLKWKKGLATWFGSVLMVPAINCFSIPTYLTGTPQKYDIIASMVSLIIGFYLMFIGFKKQSKQTT